MKIFGRTITPLFLAVVILASCNSFKPTPTTSSADMMETAISTASTAFAETQRISTNTPLPLPTIFFPTTPIPISSTALGPSSTPLVFTDPSIPLSERIVYYYFVLSAENPIPEGTVLAVHLLAPTYSDETYTSDTVANLKTALRIVLNDSRNIWIGSDLEIDNVNFRNGHADVVLQGEYFGIGGAVLEAASRQILLTVFANPSVQTATISLNGDTIWNLGVSLEENAKPDDYVYTRVEIETFINEHAYVPP
ncbi:MAG: hypothetical protein H7Y59_14140 [Anaerolineales bacterium]|nr:hypothetical protein [Anaerolineales bacterium]